MNLLVKRIGAAMLAMLLPLCASAQGIVVKGSVKDASGAPLVGAYVLQDGTMNGTTTDLSGLYQITVPAQSRLTVSMIGYVNQTVDVAGRSAIDFVLQDDNEMLEETVVVGYGSIKKSDISGSIASVDKDQMMKRSPINLAQGLQGMAAGVLVTKNSGAPDGSATIRIRGIATVNGSADPLYVVDGVVVGTNSSFLNPADIESIEILKDASATAIYGSRGANGVILVTTKRGSKDRAQVEFNANVGVLTPPRRLDVGDAQEFAYSVRAARANDGSALTNLAFGEQYADKLNTMDWQDIMTRTAIQQNYNVSASGGNDKTRATASFGWLSNEGIVIASKFTRLNARASVSHKVKDFLEVGTTVNFSHSENIGSGNVRQWAVLTPTMDYVDQFSGQFIQWNDYHQLPDGTWPLFMQVTGEGDIAKGLDNPYAAKMEADTTPTFTNSVIANAFANITLLKGLVFHSIGSYRLTATDNSSFSIRNTRLKTSSGDNIFSLSQSQVNNLELEDYLSYDLTAGAHKLQLMAGHSISRQWGHNVGVTAYDFASETYRDVTLSSAPTRTTVSGNYSLESRFISFYGRAIYTLLDRYVLTATVRRDGSSNFGAGNRWGTFPSAAFAWRLSEEEFIKDLGIFSNLKLRLGWGQTGNAGSATNNAVAQLTSARTAYDWGTLGGSLLVGDGNEKVIGYAQTKEVDTNLKWETNTQTNVGLDLGFFKNALNITVDYFVRNSTDLLLNRKLRPSSGFTQVYTNVGEIRNKGFEFSANFKHYVGDFSLNATLTGSTIKNEVINVGDPIISNPGGDSGDGWDKASITQNGYAVGSYYGYIVEDIFRSQADLDAANKIAREHGYSAWQQNGTSVGDFKYKDINGDGHIGNEDMTVLGNGFPKLNYGINLALGWKNVDLTIYGYGVAGMTINSYSSMKLTQIYRTEGGTQNTLREYIHGAWSPSNTDAIYPRMTLTDINENRRASSAYLKKGDFFKLATLQLGYTFPKKLVSLVKMESVRAYVSAENLACFSSYNKWGDPEIGTASIQSTGFDGGRYPYPRTVSFGLNIIF